MTFRFSLLPIAAFVAMAAVHAQTVPSSDDVKAVSGSVPTPEFPNKVAANPTPTPEAKAPLPVLLNGKPLPTPEPDIVPMEPKAPQKPEPSKEAASETPTGQPSAPELAEKNLEPLPDVTSTPDVAANPASEPDLDLGDPMARPPISPSLNMTINLINRLVKKGVLSKEDAAEMMREAEADTMVAEQEASRQQEAVVNAAVAQALADHAAVAEANRKTFENPPSGTSEVRVTYIPEVVKTQMRDQIKSDIMAEAKRNEWGASKLLPSWVTNIDLFGDIRVRYEADFFPPGNDNTGAFPNFNAINTGSPFDVAGTEFSPQYNVDQDRNRMRLRARFGSQIDIGQNWTMGFRVATGDSNNPVSANQSLGLANNSQGGQFSKYAIWLDRAFIKYEIGLSDFNLDPNKKLEFLFGRFDNPFFTVSSIMWDDEIGFDGVALRAKYEVADGVMPFVNGGAFPVFNTDFNFSSNQPSKFKSEDKWLFAGQIGVDWDINKDFNLTVGTAYYYFYNVEGRLSTPYTPLTSDDAGDTDGLRPSFAQKGNTYMALRNIVPDASNDFGTINQWQYFGLATPYNVLAFTGRLDYDRFAPFRVSLLGEFAANLAWNKNDINAWAVNNRGPLNDDDLSDTIGEYEGGNLAWIVELQIGTAKLEKRWDWNVGFAYRYVESDAVIDGFNESDFGGGGTNLMGYVIGGNLAVADNVWLGVKWLSGESIAGPTYKEDIIQFDLNARF